MVRLYLVPIIGDGLSRETKRRPKYFSGTIASWSMTDFGQEPWGLVGADLSPVEHTAIASQSDAFALPQNLDQAIGATLNTVQTALETMNVPAHWVTSGMTYRQVIQILYGIFSFFQRYSGLYGVDRIFGGAITLETQWSDIPVVARARIKATADSFGLDTSGVTSTTTVRQMLKGIADQLGIVTLPFGV
jgi:hypothetical protein